MSCLFCKIVQKEIPAEIIFENDQIINRCTPRVYHEDCKSLLVVCGREGAPEAMQVSGDLDRVADASFGATNRLLGLVPTDFYIMVNATGQ